jgi:hypothetical protein
VFRLFLFRLLFIGLAYHVHALKAETTGFMVAVAVVLPYRVLGRGLRGSRSVGGLVLVVRGSGMNAVEVLLRRSRCKGGGERVW